MIVSHTWLAEHINDPNIVILDSCGNDGSIVDWAGRRLPLA